MTKITDYRLFKYRTINKRLIDSLVNTRLWCARPDTLNDPLDCQIDLHEAWKRACSLSKGGKKDFLQKVLNEPNTFENVKEKLSGVGICSFSLDLNKRPSASVQWSHYANEHKGVCLLYRFPESFLTDSKNKILIVKDVTYKNDEPTKWLVNTKKGGPDFLNDLAVTYLSAKSPAWEYEREVRIIRHEPGYLNIPLGYLEQVCFGLRTPEADIELVEKLAREHCGCKIFCRIIRDEKSDFGIRAVDM